LLTTQTRSEATAARIIAAAKSLFVARNYSDVTTDMIATAAEITKGGLYHHFASKEDLYLAMMLGDFEDKRRLFEQAVAKPGTCRDRLTQLTRDYLELPHEERELTHLVRRDVNTFSGKERDSLISAYQKALPAQIETIINDGIRDEEVAACDARILAWSFVALVEVVIGQYAEVTLENTEAQLEHVLGLFFGGVSITPKGEPA
jgi:AcrR family transcriptional regulator|tara:strand:- start:116 stop:727 length:612 start_codon:yes stop_codon:yes gene_type:complete